MKILRIRADGLPLFKNALDLSFYAKQRVTENNRDSLYHLSNHPSVYLNTATAMIGLNASGKTSVMKVIELAMTIVRNDPINHTSAKTILNGAQKAVFSIWFVDAAQHICLLQTEITSEKDQSSGWHYIISAESFWEKPLSSVVSRKQLTDFSDTEPVSQRSTDDVYLSDDVSFIIARNKRTQDLPEVRSLLSFTNVNILPLSENIPAEIITFHDPTVENLTFDEEQGKTFIHLKFYGQNEIVLNRAADLEQYLSSGTIKGIVTFSMAKAVLKSGGYLLVDEIENHFNKEIVTTLIRFFMDADLNRNGGVLIFTTHYPELLDEYDRNDSIYIIRNRGGIAAENLSDILTRNDIKKSDAYQSGYLQGTTPAYEAYLNLKKNFAGSVHQA